MKKRKLSTSMSANRYRHWENEQLTSVFTVCEKAFTLCKTKSELKALRGRLAYEFRQALRADFEEISHQYKDLFRQAGGNPIGLSISAALIRMGIDKRRA